MAYQMLTGRKPRGMAKPPSKLVPTLSKRWDAWVDKCMEVEPTDRFQSAAEALEALPKVKSGGGRKWLVPAILCVEAAAIVAAIAGGWWFGVHVPEVHRQQEVARQEAEAHAAEEARKVADAKAAAERVAAQEAANAKAEKERLEAEAAKVRAEQEHLAAARGGLIITTDPAGAEVRVGAVALDKSPLTLKEMKLGKYPVRVRLAGYDNWDGEIEVKENDFAELSVAMVSSTGVLAVTSNPPGLEAVITCDKPEAAGTKPPALTRKTPAKLMLPTGDYTVEYHRSGWGAARESAKITKATAATAEHVYTSGGLDLSSNLGGAAWKIIAAPEGTKGIVGRTGAAPSQIGDLPTGDYEIEFTREGWPALRQKATVESGASASAKGDFPVGRLEVDSNPQGAEIVGADGKVIGKTPLVFAEEPPGAYELTLRLKGYKEAKAVGRLENGQTLRLSAALEEIKGPQENTNWAVPDYNIEMVWIAPGSFTMGDGSDAHRVTLSKGYWLGKYEVTQGQWQAVMGSNPSNFKNAGSNAPVENVSWDDAMDYCRKLTAKERAAGRLPLGMSIRYRVKRSGSMRAGLGQKQHLDLEAATARCISMGTTATDRIRTISIGRTRTTTTVMTRRHL